MESATFVLEGEDWFFNDWRQFIPETLHEHWHSFSLEARLAMYLMAEKAWQDYDWKLEHGVPV